MGIFDSFKDKKFEEKLNKASFPAPTKKPTATTEWQPGKTLNNRYQIFQVLGGPGKSGMGIVFICYDHKLKQPLAIKTFQDKYLRNQAVIDRFKWEAETWIRLETHYNIVQAYWVEEIDSRPFIFMEYVVGYGNYGNDLGGWIKGGRLYNDGKPDIPLILNFAIQFCQGMIYAEKKFKELGKLFVHRDIKPQNIMVNRDKVVKVTDFGLVKAFAELTGDVPMTSVGEGINQRPSLSKSGAICGTPPYMSPEQCCGEKDIDVRSDIYAFGCVLNEMLTGKYVFEARTPKEYFFHHMNTIPASPNVQTGLDEIVMKCLEKDASRRYQDFVELEAVLSERYHALTGMVVEVPETESLGAAGLNNKGVSLSQLGFHEEAIACFKEALKIKPTYAGAHMNLGYTYGKLSRLDEEVSEYKQALKINPDLTEAHYNMANAYRISGKFEEAIAEYRLVLTFKPDDPATYNNLGLVYQAQKRYAEAMTVYRRVLSIIPNDAGAHYNIGLIYSELARYDEAILEYKQAITINPRFTEAWYNQGVVLKILGRYLEAIPYYNRALEIDDKKSSAWIEKGICYYALGRYQEAIDCFDKALEINPGLAGAWINKGNTLRELGKYQEAIACCDKVLEIDPKLSEAWANKGIYLNDLGKHLEAIECYDKALKINPRDADTWNNRGLVERTMGKLDSAIACYNQALGIDPSFAPALINKGDLLAQMGRIEEAISSLKKFMSLPPAQYASYREQVQEYIYRLEKGL
jgi:tetratricopeptide (TPR) repeat protein